MLALMLVLDDSGLTRDSTEVIPFFFRLLNALLSKYLLDVSKTHIVSLI